MIFMRSAIYINQLGYSSNTAKKAVCTGSGTGFEVISADSGRTMYAGSLTDFGYDDASGDNVKIADFSQFNLPGRYYICAGRRRSDVFCISDRPYTELKNAMIKAFYFNRCGNALDSGYAGDYSHNTCHSDSAVLYNNRAVSADVSGGWHASGNYGRYVTVTCTAIAHMLYAYKLFPGAFPEKGNIPHGGDMPDILCECRHGLEWLLKMQTRDGGVYHKVCPFGQSAFCFPEDDTAQMYIFPCSHQATAEFVAVMALASSLYERFDRDFADLMQSAAFNGWIWLSNNPEYKPFRNAPEVALAALGDLPDYNFDDTMFWTVCELYSMTGEDIFRRRIRELCKSVCLTGFETRSVGGFGALAYFLSRRSRDIEAERSIGLQFRIQADNLSSLAEKSGYGTAKAPDDYRIGSNISILASGITLVCADIILDCKGYADIAAEQFNYVLGKNPMGISYVTGFGGRSVTQPHHRPSAFDDVEKPVPGLIVIGANSGRDDDYAKWNIPKNTPPAKCYCDTGFCYSTNETSINANSAALFLAAYYESL